jgi:putative ABC transport system substrate-binding protein
MSSLPRKQDHPKEAGSQPPQKHWRNLMTKISFHFTLGAMLVALCVSAAAQQPVKIPRIGWLTGGFLSINTARQQAFREGLRDLGYVEGKNILIEWRGADNKREHRSTLAEELVRLKVDVIVTAGSGGTAVVRAATSTIPIVMAQDVDPVGRGMLPALRDLAVILLDWPTLPRS